jgi:hypothetical protein
MQLLSRTGKDLNRIGEITTLLVAGENVLPPTISKNTKAANISDQRTGDISFRVALYYR